MPPPPAKEGVRVVVGEEQLELLHNNSSNNNNKNKNATTAKPQHSSSFSAFGKKKQKRFKAMIVMITFLVVFAVKLLIFEGQTMNVFMFHLHNNNNDNNNDSSSSSSNDGDIKLWTTEAMMQRNITSVFEIPDYAWPSPFHNYQKEEEEEEEHAKEKRTKWSTTFSSSPLSCPYNISFYVYDVEDLPYDMTTAVEQKVQERIRNGTLDQENVQTEYALLRLFRSSPCRTHNATLAQFFVVPYLHFTHCKYHAKQWRVKCSHVPQKQTNSLFYNNNYTTDAPGAHGTTGTAGGSATVGSGSLRYYNPQTKNRHIFLVMFDEWSVHAQILKNHPLALSTGPRKKIIIPLIHDDPRYQPSRLFVVDENEKDEKKYDKYNNNSNSELSPSLSSSSSWWWTRPRKYAFSAFVGGLNKKMGPFARQPRRFRIYFERFVRRPDFPRTIGGLPYRFKKLAAGRLRQDQQQQQNDDSVIDYAEAYRNSVFCPVFPGDNCWQRRFFDVIRNGCLPVVLEWPSLKGSGDGRSWHRPFGCAVQHVYPFAKGSILGGGGAINSTTSGVGDGSSSLNASAAGVAAATDIEIDYDSFVVRAPGDLQKESNMTSILQVMEELLANPEEIARRQRNMMAYAPLLTFGMGTEAHVYRDAFAQVMKSLEYFHVYDQAVLSSSSSSSPARKKAARKQKNR